MTPDLVWALYARLLALVYVFVLLSLRTQILACAGSRGITPIAEKLARIRRDLGPWRAVARFPTVLWLSASDTWLRALPLIGAAAAGLAAMGIASPLMFVVAWLTLLSLDAPLQLTYPWESLLLEAGFLAMFLPAGSAPTPLLAFAHRWLLFRVMFGFGKTKFTRAAREQPDYLRSFLISQPIPSPLGWRAAVALPRWVFPIGHAALFVVEMVLPFFVFVPGLPSDVAMAGFIGLMLVIQATSNFGHFNVLVIVLSTVLLDPRGVWTQHVTGLSAGGWLEMAIAAWSIVAGLCHLPFNTWVAYSWLEWPAWGGATGPGRALLAVLRAAMPFRTVHAYGVFPPKIGAPLKFLPVIEATIDGTHWEPYEFRYMPSTERSRPRFVAPHTPRIDHWMLYEGGGISGDNYLGTLFGTGSPYNITRVSAMERLTERLMEPASPVRRLFRRLPFDGATPGAVRVRLYVFAPASAHERVASGRYWIRTDIGEHLAPRRPDPSIFSRWLPEPEQFHPDSRFERRRVPRLRPLMQARTLDEVRLALADDVRAEWDRFWTELVAPAARAAAAGWRAVDAAAVALTSAIEPARMDAFDRIHGALTTALLERMEPLIFDHTAPPLSVRSYFHASLLAGALVLGGPARTAQALADIDIVRDLDEEAPTRGLMLLTVVRPKTLRHHARKFRFATRVLPPSAPPPPVVPGFAGILPELAAALPDAGERLPRVERLPDADWALNGTRILA